ncbi:hypothetical protein GcM1_168010 [Golovinomyces cichoracearum]|uniref:Secreted effector protein n=1 Tax=Golovinomyces cichoracearum TaxID=62708 RepID=A0A420J7F6_9PEZI|nr:hypothetical protein GcM1_168010 [Golovinomyces cichoracearum]
MRSLCDVIIGFATVLQITLASSVIPFHSESSEVLALNPSSSIKEKRFLPDNISAKREIVRRQATACASSVYSDSNLQQKLQRTCEDKKAKQAKLKNPTKPPLPVFNGPSTFFPSPGPYFQVPARSSFFSLSFLRSMFESGILSSDFVFMTQSTCSFAGVARKKNGVFQKCIPRVSKKSGKNLLNKLKPKKQQFSDPTPPPGFT